MRPACTAPALSTSTSLLPPPTDKFTASIPQYFVVIASQLPRFHGKTL